MNLIDILIIVPLAWALYRGYRNGIASQVGILVGLIVGLFVAYWIGSGINLWLNVTSPGGKIVTFVAIVGTVIFIAVLAARLVSGAFNASGLGWFDQLGGALLSAVKMTIIISVLLCCFEWINGRKPLVKESTLSRSLLYYPVIRLTSYVFPYMEKAQKEIEQWGNAAEDAAQGDGNGL